MEADALAGFIAEYTPELAAQAHEVLAELRALAPGAIELVYNNSNALAIGFAPTERASDVVFSIALYPRWINLFLFDAVDFPDPEKLLQGNGKRIRHIKLRGARTVHDPAVRTLIRHALAVNDKPIDATRPGRIVIKSVSPNPRPRRPT